MRNENLRRIVSLLALFAAVLGTGVTKQAQITVLFLGNSLTAGLGLEPSQAFPALLREKADSLGLSTKMVNAGLSGETSSGGLRRVDWLLQQPVDILVLELGGNDALRGIDLSLTRQNLQGIIDKTRAKYPAVEIIVAGMQAPPNLGQEYTTEFRTLFEELARENKATLIPFLLANVGGVPELNLSDRMHPNAKGHGVISETVWKTLLPVIQRVKGPSRTRQPDRDGP
jgi:acyl-CoA thioesterase-1